jgi:hypothetical protein
MSTNATAQDPFVNFTSDQARQHLLLDIARRFKGKDAEVDKRIDAAAEQISGRPGIKSIPAVTKGEPRVPLYMEGEPGVGKTTLIRAAIIDFCKLAGLNFVENPVDGYQFGPKDFYYVTVNLSGKTNPMDIGGLPSKGELEVKAGVEARRRSSDAGEWLLSELASRVKMGAGMLKLSAAEGERYGNGGLTSLDMTVRGDADQVDLVVNNVLRQLGEEVKKHGVGLNILKEGDTPVDGRLYIQVKKGTQGTRLTAMAPQQMGADVEYVAEMLPNRRFAMAAKAPFALFNFDDVANASEAVRNVLLEVAQSNRYSGVMDIGNALVTFTGNMGAEDNTNTQSEQSDAEVTRVFKVRVRDTPRDWARRVAIKYAEVGDCMFSTFIARHGNQPGIFRDAIGDMRTAKGTPKPNSRSLENALAKVLPYFQMAKESGVSATMFADEIEVMVKGTTGPNVATSYMGYMRAMLTEAIPLADKLMSTGKLDEAKFEKHMGAGAKSSEQDFAFRFGSALADAFVDRIAFSDDARAASSKPAELATLIETAMDRMCTGLAQVDPGVMNDSLSRVMSRLGGIAKLGSHDGVEVKLTQPTFMAMAEGFARSKTRNIWVDAEKATKDFTTIVAGSNLSGASKPKASRP